MDEKSEMIRELTEHYAYNFYEIRCLHGIQGTPESDWLKAEALAKKEVDEFLQGKRERLL